MPQPNRANAEAFDGALVAAGHNVLADPKSVIEQIEHTSDDVADESLRAKPNRHANDARACDQWSDLHAHYRQRHHHSDGDDQKEQDIAKDRKKGVQPCSSARLVSVWLTQISGLDQLAIDRRLHRVPQDIGAQQDDDRAQHTVDDLGKPSVLPSNMDDVDTPAPGEHRHSANDQERSNPSFQADCNDAGRSFGGLGQTGRSEQVLDPALSDAYSERKDDDHRDEPETRHGS